MNTRTPSRTPLPTGAGLLGPGLLGWTIALAALAGAHGTAEQTRPAPTPTLGPVETLNGPDGNVAGMMARARLGEQVLGLAIACESRRGALGTIYLGAFPAQARRLQLAVRRADGQVERFGPEFTANARSGFHSPQLEGNDLGRFLAAIGGNGALVSNGFNSYFVRYGEADHAALRRFVNGCG
ncbi:MAG: hypothetical protein OXG72_02635 [Acidobacteria bacterium]|nr:hypothetical protein [Acidobacteriota bacterium]